MSIKILLYNQGIDTLPVMIENILGQNKYSIEQITEMTDEIFNAITSKAARITNKSYFSCDEQNKFIKSYNEIITKKIKEYVKQKSIDVCVLQETCANNVKMYEFKKYIASYNRYTNTKFFCKKFLITGVYNNINIELPSFIPINYFNDEQNIVSYMLHDYINVSKIFLGTKYIYIINIHNRVTLPTTLFEFHLLGIIMTIIKHDELNSNIIICGDANSERMTYFQTMYDKINKETGDAHIINLIDFIKKNKVDEEADKENKDALSAANLWSKDTNKETDISNTFEYEEVKHINTTYILTHMYKILNFKQCFCDRTIQNKNIEGVMCVNEKCNINDVLSHVNMCGKKFNKFFSINDVFYYRLCDGYTIELEKDENLCNFVLSTSSHVPYVIKLNFPETETKFNPINKPDYFNSFLEISDELVKQSSNMLFKKMCNSKLIKSSLKENYPQESFTSKNEKPLIVHTGGNSYSINYYKKYVKYKNKYLKSRQLLKN